MLPQSDIKINFSGLRILIFIKLHSPALTAFKWKKALPRLTSFLLHLPLIKKDIVLFSPAICRTVSKQIILYFRGIHNNLHDPFLHVDNFTKPQSL